MRKTIRDNSFPINWDRQDILGVIGKDLSNISVGRILDQYFTATVQKTFRNEGQSLFRS
jgi:hypothetical protein